MRKAAVILLALIIVSSSALAERILGPQPPAIVFKATIGWRLSAVAQIELDQGKKFLVIEGDVINDSDRERTAPTIRLGVRDGEGRELYHWTAKPDDERIKAKDWSPFTTRVEAPPEDARQVEISTIEGDG
jgi:hypothetical protein